LTVIKEKFKPLKISIESKPLAHTFSENEVKHLVDVLISRIRIAEKKTKEKPMKNYEYEARLATLVNPIRSTIKFGKYKLVPIETPTTEWWRCKLKFSVESIDKQISIPDATMEAIIIGERVGLKDYKNQN